MFERKPTGNKTANKPKIRRVQRDILFGDNIHLMPIPNDTCVDAKVIFQDANGNGSFGLSQEMLSKHLLLLGGTGSGKTNALYYIIDSIQKQMTDNDMMMIFDTKGDFADRFYNMNDPNHFLIGSDKTYRKISKSWNIFSELKTSTREYDERDMKLTAKEISKILFKDRVSTTQHFFVDAGADIVSKVLIHLLREAKENQRLDRLSTADFVNYVNTATIPDYHNMLYSYKDFKSATTYFGLTKGNVLLGNGGQALGVIAEVNGMVNDLFVGPFGDDYGNGMIGVQDLVRKKGKRTIFVEYDLSMGQTLAPMYRILFDLALKEAMGGRKDRSGNFYLIIDEAGVMPRIEHLQDALNFGRDSGVKVKVVAGLQTISQLYDLYGEEKGKVLMAGFMNSFCFQTLDLESRRFISERFGATYESLLYNQGGELVRTQRSGNVVEDWDIMDLKVGEAFINLIHTKPVIFKFRFGIYD